MFMQKNVRLGFQGQGRRSSQKTTTKTGLKPILGANVDVLSNTDRG